MRRVIKKKSPATYLNRSHYLSYTKLKAFAEGQKGFENCAPCPRQKVGRYNFCRESERNHRTFCVPLRPPPPTAPAAILPRAEISKHFLSRTSLSIFFSSAGYMVSATKTQLCPCSQKATTDRK